MPTSVLFSLALSLSIFGCKKQEPAPRVDPALAPGSAGSGSAATVAGSGATTGSATTGSATTGSGSAVAGSGTRTPDPTTKPACSPIEIKVANDGLVVKRDSELATKLDALEPALRELAKTCIGDVIVRVGDEVAYQTVVTVMDTATKVGFVDIGLAGPDAKSVDANASKAGDEVKNGAGGSAALKQLPIIIVTTTEITIGATKIQVTGVDAKRLDAALAAVTRAKDSPNTIIVQADKATSGKTINLIIAASQRAGFSDVLFAVKNP